MIRISFDLVVIAIAVLAVWYDNPAVVGLIVGAPMAILGFLGWWRSRGMDAAATKVATESFQAGRVKEVVEGLQAVIEALQEDNKYLRNTQDRLRERIEKLEGRIREIENGRNK